MRPLMRTGLLAGLALAGCAGKGTDYASIQQSVQGSCVQCHAPAQHDARAAAIAALDNALFTAEAFPDAHFPAGLHGKTTQQIIDAAEAPGDAALDPAMAQRKAWILHELNELGGLLKETVPPDYTDQKRFDAFVTLGQPGAYEGCEMGAKLDLAARMDPEGMPPLWASKLAELLGETYIPLSPEARQKLRDYLNGILPGGLGACSASPGESS